MKKLYFWTIAFIIIGCIVAVVSTIWFGRYPNLSEYFLYIGGAIILWIFAGFCEIFKRIIDNQMRVEENQRELQIWVTEQERNNN